MRQLFADQIASEESVEFDDATGAVLARRVERLGAIVLRESSIAAPSEESIRSALLHAIRRRGVATLPWPDGATRIRERMAFVAANDNGWPDVSDGALAARFDEWLGPSLAGIRRLSSLQQRRSDGRAAVPARLAAAPRARRARSVARRRAERVAHSDRLLGSARAESRRAIQEVFGLTESPRVLDGRVAVTMQLLSPAHRPVQMTRDLAGFWRTSYFDVRKDLRGRYPRHEWPEDPLTAAPTKRAKPRR